MSKVYFVEHEGGFFDADEVSRKVIDLYSEFFDSCDDLAFKIHMGEKENDTHLKPEWVSEFYDKIEPIVEDAVLMDCTVLYKGDRAIASSHKKLAKENGFDFAPIVIADGEKGEENIDVEIDGNHFSSVKLGKKLSDYDSVFVISHFKGHGVAGVGGALKNIGMGLGCKEGKMAMHEAFELEVNDEECVECGTCVEICPSDAFRLEGEQAKVDLDECIGCGECISLCTTGAVEIPIENSSISRLQERIAEYASGVVKDRNLLYVNFLFNITPLCDCIDKKMDPVVEDKGVLISEDPVSLDKASLDLIDFDKIKEELEEDINPEIQMEHAEKLGLGEKEYNLIKLED